MAKKEEAKKLRNHAEQPERKVVQPPQSEVQRSCHDILFALLFLGAIGFSCALAIMYGKDVLSSSDLETKAKVDMVHNFIKIHHAKYRYALKISAVIAGSCLVGSIVWTLIMLACGKMLIWLSVIAVCVVSVGSGFASSQFMHEKKQSAYWWPAAVGSLFALLVLMYVCCIRRRIAFASANLQVACKAVLSYPVILVIGALFTLVQIAWALVWIIGTYAAINHGEYIDKHGKEYSKTKKFGILIGMLVIFFWGTFVCRNVVMVSTAGTVSSWWHHSSQDRRPLTATRALTRALTLSFGSICFGSLLVSIIQTICVILTAIQESLKRSGNAVAACLLGCIGCMVTCIQKWLEYFTRFAYAYVGIYGYSFVSSGKRVVQLFESKGWSAIANDSLIVNVLFFGKIVVGFAGAAAGWGTVVYGDPIWSENVKYPEASLGLAGFLIGYSVTDVIMTVIDGAVATVFILFAEDPHSLRTSHPDAHESLQTSWKQIYPTEFENAAKTQDTV